MSALGGPVGGVIGAPLGQSAGSKIGFNEVLAVYSEEVSIASGATVDIPIPFSFSSPAELDVCVSLSVQTSADGNMLVFSGSPAGLAAQFGFGDLADSVNYRTIRLIDSALRVSVTGTATLRGRIQIIKRNRRVRASGAIVMSATEALLPFAITDPKKAMLTMNTSVTIGASASTFINDYYVTSVGVYSWHLALRSPVIKVRIMSSTTYITSGSGGSVILTEFE